MIDNILKGPLTSILGVAIMGLATYAMYVGTLTVKWEGSILFILGFCLLFMKDQLPSLIKKIVDKFTNGSNDNPNVQ